MNDPDTVAAGMASSTVTLDDLYRIVDELSNKIQKLEYQRELVMASPLDTGDTAWMMASSALVLLMTVPGLSLYYAGMAPKKSSMMTIAMQAFTVTCVVSICWMFFGYSLAFSPASPVIGDYSRFFLINVEVYRGHAKAPTVPESVFCMFQLGFAVIAAALMAGASADRMKYYSMVAIIVLWHLLVYCPIAHANWSVDGFLHNAGVLDYAGGNVVHIAAGDLHSPCVSFPLHSTSCFISTSCACVFNAGMSGLMSSFIVGKRHGYDDESHKFTPNNMMHTITGACFLWIGWFGFNGGSSFGADEQAAMAILMTQIATSTAAFSWILTEYAASRVPTVLGMVNGAIAGLIAVTPAAGYVDSVGAFFIGLLSGPICYLGIRVKQKCGFDDALDAFGLHGIAGVYGGFMTGLFAKNFGGRGAFYGRPIQLAIQLYGIVVSTGWSLLITFIILFAVNACMGIRVSLETEKSGLDRAVHGEGLYNEKKELTPSDRVAELLRAYAEAKSKGAVTGTAEASGAAALEAAGAGRNRALSGMRSEISEDSDLTSSAVGWMERNNVAATAAGLDGPSKHPAANAAPGTVPVPPGFGGASSSGPTITLTSGAAASAEVEAIITRYVTRTTVLRSEIVRGVRTLTTPSSPTRVQTR